MTFYLLIAYVLLPLLGVATVYYLRKNGMVLAIVLVAVSTLFLILKPSADGNIASAAQNVNTVSNSITAYIMIYGSFGYLAAMVFTSLIMWIMEFMETGATPINIVALVSSIISSIGLLIWIFENSILLGRFFVTSFFPIAGVGYWLAVILFAHWILFEKDGTGTEPINIGQMDLSNFSFEKKTSIDESELEKYRDDIELLFEHSILGAISPVKMKAILVAIERNKQK